MEEILLAILKEYIKQYDKGNTMSVAMQPNGKMLFTRKLK